MKTITFLITFLLVLSCSTDQNSLAENNEVYIQNAEKYLKANSKNDKIESFKITKIDSIKPWSKKDELALDTLEWHEIIAEQNELISEYRSLNLTEELAAKIQELEYDNQSAKIEYKQLMQDYKNASKEKTADLIRFSTEVIYKDGSSETIKVVLPFNKNVTVAARLVKRMYSI